MNKSEILRRHLEPFVGLKVQKHHVSRNILWNAFCGAGDKIHKRWFLRTLLDESLVFLRSNLKRLTFNRGQHSLRQRPDKTPTK